MVVVAAEQKVGAKIEVLLTAVAYDIRRVGHPQSPPRLVMLPPGSDLLNIEAGHRKMERSREVRPKSISVEVRPVESVPGSIDSFSLSVL